MPLMQPIEYHYKKMETKATSSRETQAFLDHDECGLCYEKFAPTDDVVYCTKHHLFHVACFDDKFIDVATLDESAEVKCPTCNSRMHGLESSKMNSTISTKVTDQIRELNEMAKRANSSNDTANT